LVFGKEGTLEAFFNNHPNTTSSFLSVLGDGMSSSTGAKWRMVPIINLQV
jgi:hypothetical protein